MIQPIRSFRITGESFESQELSRSRFVRQTKKTHQTHDGTWTSCRSRSGSYLYSASFDHDALGRIQVNRPIYQLNCTKNTIQQTHRPNFFSNRKILIASYCSQSSGHDLHRILRQNHPRVKAAGSFGPKLQEALALQAKWPRVEMIDSTGTHHEIR